MNLKIVLGFLIITVLYTEDYKKKLKPAPLNNLARKKALTSIVSLFWMAFWGIYVYFIYF